MNRDDLPATKVKGSDDNPAQASPSARTVIKEIGGGGGGGAREVAPAAPAIPATVAPGDAPRAPAPQQPHPRRAHTVIAGPVFGDEPAKAEAAAARHDAGMNKPKEMDKMNVAVEPAVGWLVIVEGRGKGTSHEIHYGMNTIGRGGENRISINFGDMQISSDGAAIVTFDEIDKKFYVSHNNRANIVRLNGKPVLQPVELEAGFVIQIGETKLMFVPLCGPAFSWETTK